MAKEVIFHVGKTKTIDGKTKRVGKPTHTLYFTKDENDSIYMGWSICHKNDNFSRHIGITNAKAQTEAMVSRIAMGRTIYVHRIVEDLPITVKKDIMYFVYRAKKALLSQYGEDGVRITDGREVDTSIYFHTGSMESAIDSI